MLQLPVSGARFRRRITWIASGRANLLPSLHGPIDVALGIFGLERLSLVECLAALGDAELDLGDPLLEVERQRDHGVSLLARLDLEFIDLAAVEQQLAWPLRDVIHPVGLDVFGDVASEQP